MYDEQREKLPNGTRLVLSMPIANTTGTYDVKQAYMIDAFVAGGGFSLIYLAHEEATDRPVVIKELFPGDDCPFFNVKRDENGKIIIENPFSGIEDEHRWISLLESFIREKENTQIAGTVEGFLNGTTVLTNNTDVLRAEGPFKSEAGNSYLVIDTAQGQTLRQIIENGFWRNSDGSIEYNQNIEKIVGILARVSSQLTKLHKKMLHLDLSADNIYVVTQHGGKDFSPRIIDYASALRVADNPNTHVYTFNFFSSPEVRSLASFGDEDKEKYGYRVTEKSDVYSIVDILFYALTGQSYSVDGSKWREFIREKYPDELFPTRDSDDSGADFIIELFKKGLASRVDERYSTWELEQKLSKLSSMLQQGSKLGHVDSDTLVSYTLLDAYPLYDYFSDDGNIHVLCIGFGAFNQKFVQSVMSVGQMIGAKLYVHVVAREPELKFVQKLQEKAPYLHEFSNLDYNRGCCSPDDNLKNNHVYVTFSYNQVANLKESTICETLLEQMPDARYVVVSVGRDFSLNREIAERFYEKWNHTGPAVILYYQSQDEIETNRLSVSAGGKETDTARMVQLHPFGDTLSRFSSDVARIEEITIREAFLYEKLYNPTASKRVFAYDFARDSYGQPSSCAAAIHLKYKLASVGIETGTDVPTENIIQTYEKVRVDRIGELMELEHRRWLMYMVCDGYSFADANARFDYGFSNVDGQFNNAWKCVDKKVHHCLVPCSSSGIVLGNWSQADWDLYTPDTEDEKFLRLDDLDKISLQVHYEAGRRIKKLNREGRLNTLFDELEEKIRDKCELNPDLNCDELLGKTRQTRKVILSNAYNMVYADCKSQLNVLEECISKLGEKTSYSVAIIKNTLEIYKEFSLYRDYKAPDTIIIENLLWVLYGESDLKN